MRHLTLLSVFVSLGCAGLGGGGGGEVAGTSSGAGASRNEAMPDLVMRAMSGRGEIRLRSLKGKVVLLDVWASWCPPCREELPLLDDLAKRMRGQGVEVIAVSVDEDRAAAQEMARMRPRWHLTLAHDPSIADSLKPPTMPSTYLIDARGRLDTINAGFEPDHIPRIEARLRALVGRR